MDVDAPTYSDLASDIDVGGSESDSEMKEGPPLESLTYATTIRVFALIAHGHAVSQVCSRFLRFVISYVTVSFIVLQGTVRRYLNWQATITSR